MKTRLREVEPLASSHTAVRKALLEFRAEGDADADDGAKVDADDADSGADPDFMILTVGLG